MKNVVKYAVTLSILFALAVSCTRENTGQNASDSDKVRVAFSQCQSSDPWRIAETNDIMRAAKEHGFDLIYTDAQGDTSKQISDVEDIVAQGVDYLIFDGREFEASAAALDITKKAGVKVILIDRLVRGTAGVDYITYIGTDFIWEGQACAEWVNNNTPDNARIVEIYGTPGSSAAEDRHKGFEAALSGSREIIISQTADFSRAQAQQVVENAIQSTQGNIDVIFAHNDEMGMGAIQALKSAGIQPGKDILVVSIDGQQDAVKAVIAGELGCTVTCNPLYGDITFETLEKIIAGEKVPEILILEDIVIDSSNAEARLPLAH
jgi:ribose transport system substrate-binding protein